MSKITGQPQVEWWDRNDESQVPSAETRKWWCDALNNPQNPFHNFIGNGHAVRRLNRAAFAALERYNHRCSDFSFALIGPPSTGKATLVRMFVDMLRLPLVELSLHNCPSMTDVASQIAEVCKNFDCGDGCTLELRELVGDIYMIPPIIVFVNGFHTLAKKVEQGLAKAVHGSFTTENGFSFNSSHVCWIISTTNDDLLDEPFDTFAAIQLKPLSAKEVAQVVAVHNPDWDPDVCQIIAQRADSPREALAFAKEMRSEYEMNGESWEKAIAVVAKDRGTMARDISSWSNRLGRNTRN